MKKFLIASYCCLFGLLVGCQKKEVPKKTACVEYPELVKKYGFFLDNYEVINDTIQPGDSFGTIMDENGVGRSTVFEISNKVKDSFNVARINAGKPYTILKSKDSLHHIKAFIYQKNKVDYTIINLSDSIYVENKHKKVITKRKVLNGIIESSLSEAIQKDHGSAYLTHLIAGIYQWNIDFFRIQKGDRFKIIYYDKYLEDGTYVGVKGVEAAVFEHNGTPFYGFEYEIPEDKTALTSYYDEKAKSLQSFFLKAPLQFSRISSRFSPRRFHPVQKRWKAHKGTDYAAPHGTPIWSTANGTVEKAGYTRGNGKYVKVRHNQKYSTQYLHMSKIDVKKGQVVKQGQMIGRVGSTGLATGPHVCYRFWVNGKQVDPYRHKLPSAKDLPEAHKKAYFTYIESLKKELDNIPFKELKINHTTDEITFTESDGNKSLESATRAL